MLKLAFGATALLAPLTGIGQYALQLARGLQSRPDIDVSLFYGRRFLKDIPAGNAVPPRWNWRPFARRVIPNAYALRRLVEQHAFEHGARAAHFHLYHEPNFLPLRFEGPTVVTVHDLSWIRYPETHPVERVRAMNRYFEPNLRRATLLLTDSEFVRRELMEVFHVPAERIRAVLLGVDPVFRPMDKDATASVLTKHGLVHRQYFVSVGTLEPRKNLATTLQAYACLPHRLRERLPLVLIGMKGWRTTAMEKTLEPLVRSGQVRVLGYLARDELAAVTAGASSMVYPSIYEGFGLPPLEAMGCGVPAIVSNVSSLPEVVGDTGIMVDPHDIDALSSAMHRLAEDDQLRGRLGLLARERAATFTWQRCAAETVDAYRAAIAAAR